MAKKRRRSRRRNKSRRRYPSRKRSTSARRRALSRVRRSRPKRRNLARRRRRNSSLRRNAQKAAKITTATAKSVGLGALKVGAGYITGIGVGHQLGRMTASPAAAILGNILTIAGFEIAHKKVPFIRKNDKKHLLSIGAGVALLYNAVGLLSARGLIPLSVGQYLPGAVAPIMAPAEIPIADGTGAFVEQAGLYGGGGMGSSSGIEAEIQHKLNMAEGGMGGGIFDSKTTLGEYDVLASAPAGTNVQAAFADYMPYPPSLGVNVQASTAGLGAEVQEAFAGPSLREYVATPLAGMADYVPTGPGVSPAMSNSTLQQVEQAARSITAQRVREGLPVDAQYAADLQRAAMSTAAGDGILTQHPPASLTRTGAPFPGFPVSHAGGIAGQPVALDRQEEGNEGIFG